MQARVKVHIDQAKEQAQKLLVLEASAKAEAFFFLHAKKERAGEEACLATEVGRLQHMVEGQAEYDREAWLLEELQLQAARDAKFRVRFNQFLHGKRVQMAEFIQRSAERAGTPLLLPADTPAFGPMCLCDGVQSYYTADPQHVSADVAESVLAGFFARVVLGRAPD